MTRTTPTLGPQVGPPPGILPAEMAGSGASSGIKRPYFAEDGHGLFDRINGVGIVLTPALGIGYGDVSVCRVPSHRWCVRCLVEIQPPTSDRGWTATTSTIPALPAVSSGVIIPWIGFRTLAPAITPTAYTKTATRGLDPKNRIGSAEMIDFSIQRELPGKMLLEVGYVGLLRAICS